jgi:hypothetical protein
MTDDTDPLASGTEPSTPPPAGSGGDPLGSGDGSLLEWGERKAAGAAVGMAEDDLKLMPRTPENLEAGLALDDLDRELRASGDHSFSISPHIDPTAIADLLDRHSSSEPDKEEAKSGRTSHYLSLEFSNMTWGDFQTKLGSTSLLSDAAVSLTPAQPGTPLGSSVHADLIRQHWADIGGAQLTTDLQGALNYTDHKGVGGSIELRQDLTFKSLAVEAEISTDLRTGDVSVVGGLKWSF